MNGKSAQGMKHAVEMVFSFYAELTLSIFNERFQPNEIKRKKKNKRNEIMIRVSIA